MGAADFQSILSSAIYDRQSLRLRCEGDRADRLFEPYILYRSRMGKLKLAGNEVVANNGRDRRLPKIFDLAQLVSVRFSGLRFLADPAFDTSDPHYQFGILCRVSG